MATKIGDLFFDVYADVSRAIKNVDDLQGKFVAMGGAAAKAIGETVANAVGIAVGATALLIGATLNAGAAYNTLGQSATAAFSSIYGDLSAAHSILQDISTLDLETPFSGKALTSTARTLAGFGFQLQDVTKTTAALAQATAAMGLGSDALHRMAIAFGQIQSRGKLAGDEARQLANYGIDAYGLLADKLGMTVAAVRELGQEGKLTSDFVIPALVESIESRFAGATEALFNTAAGQAEGLRSVMEAVGSALVEPFIGFSGGGALVDAMQAVRTELVGLVTVAEDGSFQLQGFLEPLEGVVQGLADGFESLATSFAGFLGGLSDTALTDLADNFDGLGPTIAGVGAALLTVFAQAIPFVGRFVAGFNPIVVGLVALSAASSEVRESLGDTFERIWVAVQPLIPGMKELVQNIQDLAEEAIPIVLDAIASAVEDLAPATDRAVDALNSLLEGVGPALIEILQALADALGILGAIFGALPEDVVVATAALYALDILLPTVTTGLVAATGAAAASGPIAAAAATQWGILGTAIAAALVAASSFKAVSAGLGSFEDSTDYLNKDMGFGLDAGFQQLGRFGYALGGGDREQDAATLAQMQLLEEGKKLGEEFAKSMDESGMSMLEFGQAARDQLPTQEAVNYALIAYRDVLDEIQQANLDAAAATDVYTSANLFEARVAEQAKDAANDLMEAQEEEINILKELGAAAKAAWVEVDRLLRPTTSVTLDDFLRSLPDLATDVTDALQAQSDKPGLLADLQLSGAKEAVQSQARELISSMAKTYGIGLQDVLNMLNQRGLAGVIQELGTITKETTETVDPMIAKYASLGATTSQLNDAISRLNDQRQTAIKAQIDQVAAALKDAKQAADDARAAFDNYFKGSSGGLQGAIDKLVLAIPNVGDQIEAGLLKGGPQGEAMVRQAIGGAGDALGEIFQLGLEQGLSPEQIMDMLGPVYGSIQQELSGALNRISSLDWTEGFTPAAAAEIQGWFASILDPGQIGALFQNILGADSTVSGLERRLEELNAQLQVDVEFSPAQVQGALDELTAEQTKITTTPVVTPEAAQLVWDFIQDTFDDPNNELGAAVDQAIITQQILDAAQAAEDQISLVFQSALSFDSAELDAIARQVSDEFYAAFTDQMNQLRDQRAQEAGFDSYSQMVSALGPQVAAATIGNVAVQIDAPIQVTATGLPPGTEISGTQTVAGYSAAAGSNGSVPRSLQDIYGVQVIPGLRGPQ